MSRRARTRAQARPWQSKPDQETPIDWAALAADRAKREQQEPATRGDSRHAA